MKYRIWYIVSDQGDGSVCAYFYATEEKAKEAEKINSELMGYGWAEDSASYQDLEFDMDSGLLLNPDSIGYDEETGEEIY